MNIEHTFLQRAKEIEQVMIKHRRTLHENPELSFEEHETSLYIRNALKDLNIDFKVMGETGVVATVGKGSRCVALRADIDALPMSEETDLPFASTKQGVMHACGHDAHTAMLLGAAQILKENETSLNGTVKLIFQPGEEKVPGGASILIKEGVLNDPAPEVIFGQHVNPDAPAGIASFVAGNMMASADELYWTICGRGAHAAQPQKGSDPIVAASALIMHLQTLISRQRDPLSPGVLSVTAIHGGTVTNIIPEEVILKGTLRSYDNDWREETLEKIQEHSEMIARLHGCGCDFKPLRGYPPLINDTAATHFAKSSAIELLGENSVTDFEPKMWGEDFAFYAQQIPACFWMLGVRPLDKDEMPGLHNPKFTPDESAFAVGCALMASAAANYLSDTAVNPATLAPANKEVLKEMEIEG
ncbi:MAG: M20 family metallopeptidase [Bacteroidota bacterium]